MVLNSQVAAPCSAARDDVCCTWTTVYASRNSVLLVLIAEAVTEDASAVDTDDDNGDDYDELIDISKPVKEGKSLAVFAFYRATRMHSADYAVARLSVCLSVPPSVCHTPVFSLNGDTYLQSFFQLG